MEMQITINGIIFHSDKNIEVFPVLVSESNYRLISKKLESERNKIIDYLKDLKSKGEIKSIFRPKNKQIQEHLNELCKLKKHIKTDIDKLKIIYQ